MAILSDHLLANNWYTLCRQGKEQRRVQIGEDDLERQRKALCSLACSGTWRSSPALQPELRAATSSLQRFSSASLPGITRLFLLMAKHNFMPLCFNPWSEEEHLPVEGYHSIDFACLICRFYINKEPCPGCVVITGHCCKTTRLLRHRFPGRGRWKELALQLAHTTTRCLKRQISVSWCQNRRHLVLLY